VNNQKLKELVLYIVDQVADLDGYTTTIRLVKYIYLIDLEHYRRYGKKLTDLRWFYHHYGPYAFALPKIGRSIGFDLRQEEFETQSGKKGRVFRVREPQDLPEGLSFSVASMINGLLQIWANQDTSELLAYVYKTEPMIKGTRGQELDFSVVPQGSKYYELYVPTDKKVVKQIRESLTAYFDNEISEFVEPNTKSNLFAQEALQALEDDELILLPGIHPAIPNENDLTNSLPKGE